MVLRHGRKNRYLWLPLVEIADALSRNRLKRRSSNSVILSAPVPARADGQAYLAKTAGAGELKYHRVAGSRQARFYTEVTEVARRPRSSLWINASCLGKLLGQALSRQAGRLFRLRSGRRCPLWVVGPRGLWASPAKCLFFVFSFISAVLPCPQWRTCLPTIESHGRRKQADFRGPAHSALLHADLVFAAMTLMRRSRPVTLSVCWCYVQQMIDCVHTGL